ncbi:hypothetical protein G7Y89_g1887 [Cudoniella acicularis]|uniref:Uncharacterized protein n=1 Tax=Cudoniella acicularis TaxID=354080 RepID=A0A8H4W6K5_9HELO|nr:hypothetical protein G7Y89_g1887 [Cudoniella acicularis]
MAEPSSSSSSSNPPHVTPLEWYENRNKEGKPQAMKKWSIFHYTKGFNITKEKYHEIDEYLCELLKSNKLYKEATGTVEMMKGHHKAIQELRTKFPILTSDSVPGIWAQHALEALVRDSCVWMIKNEAKLDQPRKRRLPKSEATAATDKPKEKKTRISKASKESKEETPSTLTTPTVPFDIPYKNCYFLVTVRGNAAKNATVPLIDLVGESFVAERDVDLNPGTLELSHLHEFLKIHLKYGVGDGLIYCLVAGDGKKIDVEITMDNHLRNAAICLRTPGISSLNLEVIKSIKKEDDGDEAMGTLANFGFDLPAIPGQKNSEQGGGNASSMTNSSGLDQMLASNLAANPLFTSPPFTTPPDTTLGYPPPYMASGPVAPSRPVAPSGYCFVDPNVGYLGTTPRGRPRKMQ